MADILIRHRAGLTVDVAPFGPDTGGEGEPGVIDRVVAGMAPNSWAMLPAAANQEAALASPNPNPQNNQNGIVVYGGLTDDGVIVGCDHGTPANSARYDRATHSWSNFGPLYPDVHPYQHTCKDEQGTLYRIVSGLRKVRVWGGSGWENYSDVPMWNANHVATALVWWNGKLTWSEGATGFVYQYNGSSAWAQVGRHPTQSSVYHNEAATTPAGLLFGGGNDYQGVWQGAKELYLLRSDLTRVRLADAPYRIGIYGGMTLIPTPTGAVMVGFDQCWGVNLDGGPHTQLAAPPATLKTPPATDNTGSRPRFHMMAWLDKPSGAVICINKTTMHVYRP